MSISKQRTLDYLELGGGLIKISNPDLWMMLLSIMMSIQSRHNL
jgi:hypothetical protein